MGLVRNPEVSTRLLGQHRSVVQLRALYAQQDEGWHQSLAWKTSQRAWERDGALGSPARRRYQRKAYKKTSSVAMGYPYKVRLQDTIAEEAAWSHCPAQIAWQDA